MVVMLKQCCCGCSLKTGSSIISFTDATIGAISMILAVAGPEFAKNHHGVFEVLIASGVTGGILILVSIFLFFGARSGQPKFLMPWLLYACIYLILSFIQHLLLAINNFSQGSTGYGVAILILLALHESMQIYCLLVVYSYYRDLKGQGPSIP